MFLKAPGALLLPTYADLEQAIQALGRSDGATVLSTLKQWCRIGGYTATTPLGAELSTAYQDALPAFHAARQAEGAAATTRKSDTSRMKIIQAIAGPMIEEAATAWSKSTFADRLRAARTRSSLTLVGLAESVGVSVDTISTWSSGKTVPTLVSARSRVPALEAALALPAGTLIEVLPLIPSTSRYAAERADRALTPFGLAVRTAMRAKKLSIATVARLVSGITQSFLHPQVLSKWVRPHPCVPSQSTRQRVLPALAEVLGLDPSALCALLPPVETDGGFYGARRALVMTPTMQTEWDAFYAHKTQRDESDARRRPLQFWRIRDNGTCPTAEIAKGTYLRFGRWLTEDPGARKWGVTHATFGLADLLRVDAFKDYLRWHATTPTGARAYNRGHLLMLQFAVSLCRDKTGYLWQAHDVDLAAVAARGIHRGGAGGAPTLSEWRTFCEQSHLALRDHMNHLRAAGLVHQSRDYRHIAPILEAPRPAEYLALFVTRMQEDLSRVEKMGNAPTLAVFRRDLLYGSMLTANPLRGGHWQQMTYREDNSGHLRHTPDGHYELHIPAREFKALSNHRSNQDYVARIPHRLTPLITAHLTVDRPQLAGATTCDYVFRPVASDKRDPNASYCDLGDRLVFRTRHYLSDIIPRGFNPHAVRHIIATHLVKADPINGIRNAAAALHNTEAMIRLVYGHLVSQDHTDRAQVLIDEALGLGV